jgi:hypothetical protein
MLAEKGLTTRPIAAILGVDHATIAKDLRGGNTPKTGENPPPAESPSSADTAADRARNEERAAEVAAVAEAEGGQIMRCDVVTYDIAMVEDDDGEIRRR